MTNNYPIKTKTSRIALAFICFALFTLGMSIQSRAESIKRQWTHQFGTSESDIALAFASDHVGNIYVTGRTEGTFEGYKNNGDQDIFLAKFDSQGKTLWVRQFGTPEMDEADNISVDHNGNVYIAGFSEGNLGGGKNNGEYDVFLAKYNSKGERLWIKLYGTNEYDMAVGIAVDSNNNIFVSEYMGADFVKKANASGMVSVLHKLNAYGETIWVKEVKSPKEFSFSGGPITLNAKGNVLMTGHIQSETDLRDCFIAEFDDAGEMRWFYRKKTPETEEGDDIATDQNGNIYVTGMAHGDYDGSANSKKSDLFLYKFNSKGKPLWSRRYSTKYNIVTQGMAVDKHNKILITGNIFNAKDQINHDADGNILILKYNSDGIKENVQQFGTDADDRVYGIATGKDNDIYVMGYTSGGMDGNPNIGYEDVFIAKLQTIAKH